MVGGMMTPPTSRKLGFLLLVALLSAIMTRVTAPPFSTIPKALKARRALQAGRHHPTAVSPPGPSRATGAHRAPTLNRCRNRWSRFTKCLNRPSWPYGAPGSDARQAFCASRRTLKRYAKCLNRQHVRKGEVQSEMRVAFCQNKHQKRLLQCKAYSLVTCTFLCYVPTNSNNATVSESISANNSCVIAAQAICDALATGALRRRLSGHGSHNEGINPLLSPLLIWDRRQLVTEYIPCPEGVEDTTNATLQQVRGGQGIHDVP